MLILSLERRHEAAAVLSFLPKDSLLRMTARADA